LDCMEKGMYFPENVVRYGTLWPKWYIKFRYNSTPTAWDHLSF